MQVVYLRSFLNDLKKLKDKSTKDKVKAFIIALKQAQRLEELPNVKKLKGYSIAYRARIGEYRLGIYKEDQQIELARFVKRNYIYKLFPKKGSK
jgi:mRNA interferase RelE/StbE